MISRLDLSSASSWAWIWILELINPIQDYLQPMVVLLKAEVLLISVEVLCSVRRSHVTALKCQTFRACSHPPDSSYYKPYPVWAREEQLAEALECEAEPSSSSGRAVVLARLRYRSPAVSWSWRKHTRIQILVPGTTPPLLWGLLFVS